MQTIHYYLCCDVVAQSLRRDRWILGLIQHVFFTGKPQARRMLQHYLGGTGEDQAVDMTELLQDAGLRHALAQALSAAGSEAQGEVAIPQWHWANRAWRYALGSVTIRWQREGEELVLDLSSRYDWHPEEARVTRRIHEVADRMKARGARAFRITGTARGSLDVLSSTKPWIPRDRLYL